MYLSATGAHTGQCVRLSRPLDFLVVTDHSDNMGFFQDLFAGKPELLADAQGRRWYDIIQSGKGGEAAIEIIVAFSEGQLSKGCTIHRTLSLFVRLERVL
jgi:Protein of unknown function (DUF3604)